MEAIERLNGLKTWASETLDHEEATCLLHDLDAVIEVIEKLNKETEQRIELVNVIKGFQGSTLKHEVFHPGVCSSYK